MPLPKSLGFHGPLHLNPICMLLIYPYARLSPLDSIERLCHDGADYGAVQSASGRRGWHQFAPNQAPSNANGSPQAATRGGFTRRYVKRQNDLRKRRARDSNPQPVSRHLISSQAASHSLTLRAAWANPSSSLRGTAGVSARTPKLTAEWRTREAALGSVSGLRQYVPPMPVPSPGSSLRGIGCWNT